MTEQKSEPKKLYLDSDLRVQLIKKKPDEILTNDFILSFILDDLKKRERENVALTSEETKWNRSFHRENRWNLLLTSIPTGILGIFFLSRTKTNSWFQVVGITLACGIADILLYAQISGPFHKKKLEEFLALRSTHPLASNAYQIMNELHPSHSLLHSSLTNNEHGEYGNKSNFKYGYETADHYSHDDKFKSVEHPPTIAKPHISDHHHPTLLSDEQRDRLDKFRSQQSLLDPQFSGEWTGSRDLHLKDRDSFAERKKILKQHAQ